MKTPKEKAKEIMFKFDSIINVNIPYDHKEHIKLVKKCSLINVLEVMESGLNLMDYRTYTGDIRTCANYWQEVKKEIKRM